MHIIPGGGSWSEPVELSTRGSSRSNRAHRIAVPVALAKPKTRPDDRPAGTRKGTADDFDPVAWCYDCVPVPTHPRRLAPRLDGIEGDVVDLGGGTGRFSVRAFDPDKQRILVVDPAHKMLQKSRRKHRPVHAVQAVGEMLPLPDRSIAAVLVTEAFHHFAEGQKLVLHEVVRVLKDDGMLLIEEPDPSRFIGRIMAFGERVQKMTSVFHPPGGLAAMLAVHFESVTTKRTGWFTYLAEAKRPRRG